MLDVLSSKIEKIQHHYKEVKAKIETLVTEPGFAELGSAQTKLFSVNDC